MSAVGHYTNSKGKFLSHLRDRSTATLRNSAFSMCEWYERISHSKLHRVRWMYIWKWESIWTFAQAKHTTASVYLGNRHNCNNCVMVSFFADFADLVRNHSSFSWFSRCLILSTCSCCFFRSSCNLSINAAYRSCSFRPFDAFWKKKNVKKCAAHENFYFVFVRARVRLFTISFESSTVSDCFFSFTTSLW